MNQQAYVGGTAAFNVEAGGTLPLSYQWYFNGNPVSGATSPSLALSSVQLTNAGMYSVAVKSSKANTQPVILSATLSVFLDVPPVALPSFFGVAEFSSANQLNILQNDYDPNHDPFGISKVSDPRNGSLVYTCDAATFQYTPTPGFYGVDSFTYSICRQGVIP